MTSTIQKSIPGGLYVLNGLFLLATVWILYYTITDSSYRFIAAVSIPLFVYMGIGLIKRWPGVQQTVVAVSILLFVGAVVDIVSVLFLGAALNLTSVQNLIGVILRLTLFPFVAIFFRTQQVKTYFNVA